MVWDFNKFSMDDSLNVDEREQVIGFALALQLCSVLMKELVGRF
jgi:hypothetical protein